MALVEYEVRNKVAYITLNRPEKLNAINPEMRDLLWQSFQDVKKNSEVRVAIITGRGRAFSSGHDLKAMAEGGGDEGITTGDLYAIQYTIPKPIISAINGICLAQGCGIALSSDIRIASSEATFGWPQVKRGIASTSGPMLLAQSVPRNIAFEFLFTAEFIGAQRALELHLINKVVPPEDVMAEAQAVAEKILENAPLAVSAIKQLAILGQNMTLEGRLAFAHAMGDVVMASEDAKEGLKAFAEKRQPVWRGR